MDKKINVFQILLITLVGFGATQYVLHKIEEKVGAIDIAMIETIKQPQHINKQVELKDESEVIVPSTSSLDEDFDSNGKPQLE
jgi:hypothetical protein